jgi:hypothetical protein
MKTIDTKLLQTLLLPLLAGRVVDFKNLQGSRQVPANRDGLQESRNGLSRA